MSITDSIEENYDQLVETISAQRDELKLQIHLASMEASDEWQELEKKWEHFVSKSKQVKSQVGESAKDVGEAVGQLGAELKRGYQNIKKG
jgi:hypothetical protein